MFKGMTLHLIKLAVGIERLEDLPGAQEKWMTTYHGQPAFPVYTRRKPRRDKEILESGGSMYRVIKNRIQCRQKILGIELIEDDESQEHPYCLIFVEPKIIKTIAKPKRPFQGWRYLEASKAPADRGVFTLGDDDLDPDMEEELKAAGIL